MRTLILGDIEAQYKICRQELDLDILPEVDQVISLGNLISCTQAAKDKKELGRNEITLTFWDKIALPKIRLMGSYEIMALNFPDKWTNNTSNTYLREGWLTDEGTYLTAYADKGRLLTHAGLTYGEWVAIGRPKTAEEAAAKLNEKYFQTLNQGPCFRLDGRPNFAANPIWADPVLELYPSWIMAPEACPFDQIHGGESLNSGRGRAAAGHPSHPLHYTDASSYRKFGSLSEIKGAIFRGIDLELPARLIPSIPGHRAFYVEASR